jgi:prepilin-type N-terminal cleavage/methylation domain-containing protein
MTRRAFTLIELLVVVTIIALLIGLLVPVLASARDAVYGTSCMANQSQLMIGVTAYSVDNDQRIPFGPEEGRRYNPLRGGEDSGGRDFYVIDGMVTSEISTLAGEPLGAGLLLRGYMDQAKEAFFCPGADEEVAVAAELAKVGSDSVISGYLYRHGSNTFVDLIRFNSNPAANRMDSRTRIDRLGLNRDGEPITALFADNNFQTADGSFFEFLDRSNHERVFSNIAYVDGRVEQRSNLDERYVADIGGTTLINGLNRILTVFEEADKPQ